MKKSILVTLLMILSSIIICVSFVLAEEISGKILSVKNNTLVINPKMNYVTTIKVKSTSGLKHGDYVVIKNGNVEKIPITRSVKSLPNGTPVQGKILFITDDTLFLDTGEELTNVISVKSIKNLNRGDYVIVDKEGVARIK